MEDYGTENLINTLENSFIEVKAQENNVLAAIPSKPKELFSALPSDTPYPFYILAGDKLLYWSDNTFVPSFLRMNEQGRVQFVRVPIGSFLLLRRPIKEGNASLITVIPLQPDPAVNISLRENLSWLFADEAVEFSQQAIPKSVAWNYAGQPVFWLKVVGSEQRKQGQNLPAVVLVLLGIVLAFAALTSRVFQPTPKLLLWLLAAWLLRLLLLVFHWPFAIYPLALFDPQYYASSQFNPSLGDLTLNLALLLISSGLLFPFLKAGIIFLNRKLKQQGALAVQAFQLIFIVLLFYALFAVQRTLFFHTQYSLDITQAFEFDQFRLFSWASFLMSGFTFFILAFAFLQGVNKLPYWKAWLLILAAGALLSMLVMQERWLLASISACLFFLVGRVVKAEKDKQVTGYPFALLLLVFMAIAAMVGARTLQKYRQQERKVFKEQLATALLADHDPIAEFLLAEVGGKISGDTYILNRMFNPFISKEGVVQKIRLMLLPRYLDKYDARIYLFQPDGSPIAPTNSMLSYGSLVRKAQNDGEEIAEFGGLYLLNEPQAGSAKRYLKFIALRMQNLVLGYVVLDLGLKRYQPNLLLTSLEPGAVPLDEIPVTQVYYAVYQDKQLIYNAGAFDYVHDFRDSWLQLADTYQQGISADGFDHLAVRGAGNKVVVVTDKNNAVYVLLQNFSFFILLVLILFFCSWIVYMLATRLQVKSLSMTVKIQLYLNLAILLPLLLVTVSTLSLLRGLEKNEVEQTYYKKAEDISRHLGELLEGQTSSEYLTTKIAEIARFTGGELNLYSPDGRLLSSSQPNLFQQNYLSEYIHPLAYAEIKEQNSRQVITTEQIGRLEYKSAYMAVRSPRTGNLLGIVSLPFFDSGLALQEQEAAVFNNLVTIFVLVFLFSFFALYFLARQLTRPLRYLTDKLRLVSLSGHNEPISWRSQDEVGKLVKEYNTMLENLQESKLALSRNEKESAWREMAKQVAHEIKNPLTPMKLSLQHLNRMLQQSMEAEPIAAKVDHTVKSLLAQINTLSDIATSFSAFAKMPIPESERFEIVSLLQEVISLFRAEDVRIEAQLPEVPVYVVGDASLMQRTFNNLIKNGLQAIPNDRAACINIRLQLEGEKIRLSIEDNGLGIANDIREKVFLPNFSTKYTGNGLGLAIAKRGIEHAGGRIWFETQQNEGTVFYIELPVAE